MKTESTGIIITKIIGQNKFTFNVKELYTLKGIKKMVYVIQETMWNEEDNKLFGFEMENTINKWNFYFDVTTSEFGAINLAGKKLINNWENI
jgi:hypothetical protein